MMRVRHGIVVENGDGNPESTTYIDLKTTREWADTQLGLEAVSNSGECDDEMLNKVLRAAAEYMCRLPWAWPRAHCDQALSWPLCMPCHARSFVPSNVIPVEIRQSNVLLANDILLKRIDPTGYTKPVVTSSVSTEAASASFARPQALADEGGFVVRTKDPLYSVRPRIHQWLAPRVPVGKIIR